jgi:acyl carrier protein
MTKEQIFETVKNIIEEKGFDDLTIESSFDDLGMDSLDLAEIEMEIEVQLKISIPDEKSCEYETVNELVEIVYEILEDKKEVSQQTNK